jgi:hypothetical protein
MKKLVRCKACGYVMGENAPGDKCPACGVPRKMFEPYDDGLSDRRRFILGSHIHPVIVHAPQAFAFVLLGLAVVLAFGIAAIHDILRAAIRVMDILLPLFVAAGIGSGVFDGITRFRKASTPILARKIAAGSLFFILACGMLAVDLVLGLDAAAGLAAFLVLNVAAFGCSAILGLWGGGLISARFPG